MTTINLGTVYKGEIAHETDRYLCLRPGLFVLPHLISGFARSEQEDRLKQETYAGHLYGILEKRRYMPKLDSDGDVIFKSEGNTFFIAMSEEDPTFFRLILPNIWKVEGQTERAYVLTAADQSNAMCKVSKVFLVEDRVWVSIELFLASPEDFKSIFKRAIGALDAGASVFVLKMVEQVASHTQGSRKRA